jgi:hypothetical protein
MPVAMSLLRVDHRRESPVGSVTLLLHKSLESQDHFEQLEIVFFV